MSQNEYGVFQTSDLSLAAALCCFGAKIEAVDHNNGARAVFHFRREKGLPFKEEVLLDFAARE
ncbi:MAG: hypothetical protein UT06_C0028G0001, partial [Candidatus Woesebacteria bacterium GW2011_GWA1_38_8]